MALQFSVRTRVANNLVYNQLYDGTAVAPSDSTDLINGPCKAFYVTSTGNVNVDLLNNVDPAASGGTAVFTGLVAGQIVLCATRRIRATSTTATGIFALYDPRT